jgi:uncharacterized lipoprotein YmbA
VRILLILIATNIMSLSGCFRSANTDQFFMLDALQSQGSRQSGESGPIVQVNPVKVAAYLDRTQMVSAVSPNQYKLNEGSRWAERLDVSITRVTVQNLSGLLGDLRVMTSPMPRDVKPDYQVGIQVEELHPDADGKIHAVVSWTLAGREGLLASRRFECQKKASLEDVNAVVHAESECLLQMAREMAQVVLAQKKIGAR